MPMIDAYFFGLPTDDLSLETRASRHLYRACEKIFENHNGDWFAEDTCMINGEQALCYDVPRGQARRCRNALKEAGFRLKPTPRTKEEMAKFKAACARVGE